MRPAELLRYTILAVQREGDRRLSMYVAPLGLTTAQAEVIQILASYGQLTLTGLGELLVCKSGGNPSRLVDRLVKAEIVSRLISSTDRRQVVIDLTEKGVALSEEVLRIEDDFYKEINNIFDESDSIELANKLRMLIQGSRGDSVLKNRIN